MELSIVIPAYNEAQRIGQTLLALDRYFADRAVEILVVDDGSSDRTTEVVEKLDLPRVAVLSYLPNRGKGYAVRQGVLASRGRHVLLTDADLSTPIECFEDLWPLGLTHAVVVGSRGLAASEVKNHWHRVWLGKMGNRLIQALVPAIADTQCGFKLFAGDMARTLFAQQRLDGFGFDFEVLFLAQRWQLPIAEVPVRWTHAAGSKVKPHHYLSTLRELAQVWLNHRQRRSPIHGPARSNLTD